MILAKGKRKPNNANEITQDNNHVKDKQMDVYMQLIKCDNQKSEQNGKKKN